MSSIDVSEILRASTEPLKKKSRTNGLDGLSTATADTADILAALERDNSQTEIVDETTVKRIIMQLEKRCLKNREMRIKYSDEPTKFMDSEVDLNLAIQEMHVLATQPELYNILVDLGAASTLLQLLAHENSDVLDFEPAYAEQCVSQGLFTWLLRRATQRGPLDANKMFASELLALLLQSSESARKKLTDKIDGFDLLLRALASYKRHDPNSADEREHMENLFDAVCASLLYASNRQKFIDGEGLQLMNLMLREKKQSRESALKVLNHATNGVEGKANCNKFIEILGLRTIFPLFMRTPSKTKRKDTTPDEHEEDVCSILSSLLRSCTEDGRNRVLMKFAEHEYEKVDRALELLLKYKERVDRFDSREAKRSDASKLSDQQLEQQYLDRMESGLYTLQRIALILADVCVNATPQCRLRANRLLQMRTGSSKINKLLIPILEEYDINLAAEADEERKRTRLLIARLSAIDKNT
ncbi:unnamed protein product [Anisakis simplex]|uniref:Beta-catenin-like protein 1 n=1 Tax=Anisakis simplex TaxID=6269 RepID=A0A0M3K3Y0_ANISI|nr:unnamed protein product [Anisakis simplex]